MCYLTVLSDGKIMWYLWQMNECMYTALLEWYWQGRANIHTWKETFSSATLPTRNPTLTSVRLNPCFQSKRPATNCMSPDSAMVVQFYLVDDSVLGGSVHTIKKIAEALLVANKETELEVNADKTKYIVMSWDQNAGRSHSIKTDNSSFDRVEEFIYLGTTLTNQNSIQEEIKSRLKSGNACYYSVQNLLSSSLLSKILKIKIYRTIILPLFCMGVKLGCSYWGRNVGWGCLRIGCWGEYLGLRGTR